MKITPASNFVPAPLKTEILLQPQTKSELPGFLVGIDETMIQGPSVRRVLDEIRRENGFSGRPCFLINPDQTASIFTYEKELDLLKALTGLVAQQVHPHLKTGIDVLWLVYNAAKIYDEWKRPDRNTGACLFKIGGLALGAVGVSGSIAPDLKIPDCWANGLNFLIKSGGAVFQGKTPPINEIMLSADKRLTIPLKLLKVAGISLDPSPEFQNLSALPLSATMNQPFGTKR